MQYNYQLEGEIIINYKDLIDLTGEVAVVTGGASGLGKEMVEALLQFGANVVIVDINEELIQNRIKYFQDKYHNEIIGIKADVSNEAQVINMVNQVVNKFNEIDILINNAGVNQRIKVEDQTYKEWKKVIDNNLNSIFIVSKYIGSIMRGNKKGSIINLSSISGLVTNKEPQAAYNASKAAINNLTKSLASEWIDDNVRVNAIAPGYMRTEMTGSQFNEGGNLHHILDLIPMKRMGEPYELIGALILLASGASTYTTGTTIVVDGGYTIW